MPVINKSPFDKRVRPRRAFLLVLVMIVVVMAALAAGNFADTMLVQNQAAHIQGSRLQARMMTESALQSIRLMLAYDRLTLTQMGGTWDNPQKFQAINIVRDSDPARRGNVSVVAPSLDQSGYFAGYRFGLQNESAKLNLNILAELDKLSSSASSALSALGLSGAASGGSVGSLAAAGGASSSLLSSATGSATSGSGAGTSASGDEAATAMGLGMQLLMALPGMTEDVADAILDFVDEDDTPRTAGAEYDYYEQLKPPYSPANGPLVSIEQLLLVRGITPQMLFGYDANRNGVLDGSELSQAQLGMPTGAMPGAQATIPQTSADGQPVQLDPLGWAPYLTLHSQEKNVAADATARVNINSDDLETLYSDLSTALGNDAWASFIVQYRISGQAPSGAGSPVQLLLTAAQAAADEESKVSSLQASASTRTSATGTSGTQSNAKAWSADLLPEDLSQQQGGVKFNQILDLFGATVTVQPAGGQQGGQGGNSYLSPFQADPVVMANALPVLMDKLTTIDSPTIPGRINIMECPRAILLGIPGMTEEIVDQIIQARTDGSQTENRKFETWIAVEGFVTLDQMRGLEPLITCGGDVYKAQVIGYFEGTAAFSRVEAIVSGTKTPPQILFYRQLDHLGRSFEPMALGLRPDAAMAGSTIPR